MRRLDDRRHAGRMLAASLQHLRLDRPVVVGLPRGGVPVAYEVAWGLNAPLDIALVRKLGAPTHPELAMGAIGEDGVRVINDDVVRMVGAAPAEVAAIEARERTELQRRVNLYRPERDRIPLEGRTVIVVDDGVATGATTRAALAVMRAHGAARVVLAVPVGADDTLRALEADADAVVALIRPVHFAAVGQWYADFRQTSDADVVDLLRSANRSVSPQAQNVIVRTGGVHLPGVLTVPPNAAGVIVLAHGGDSSTLNSRVQDEATTLQQGGIATLLLDLLTDEEAARPINVFDVSLLTDRMMAATDWVLAQRALVDIPVGYFGANVATAAALRAACQRPEVRAVVSRSGRPDLASEFLHDVHAAVLLIVGSDDHAVLTLNEQAVRRLPGIRRLAVVPGATHLFEEPGALVAAATLARDWFLQQMAPADPIAATRAG